MFISDERLPPRLPLEIHADVLQQRPDIAMGVGLAIALWADIEARLDAVFLFCTRDDELLAAFQAKRGWDAKAKCFFRAVAKHQGRAAAIEVRAILRTVALPAKKRHELAHGTWALSTELPNDLVLFGDNFLLEAARQAVAAEAKCEGEMRFDPVNVEHFARVISVGHLQTLYEELSHSLSILHSFMIEKMPPVIYVNGRDQVPTARSHPDVAARIAASKIAK